MPSAGLHRVVIGCALLAAAACSPSPPEGSGPPPPLPNAFCGEFAAPPQHGGRTWVVAPDGDDAAEGSAGAPLRTVQAAADRAGAGDSVVVEDGTYTSTAHEMVRITRGGSADSWLWFRARHLRGARLVGVAPAAIGFSLGAGVGYVRIEGFDISGLDGSLGAAGVSTERGGRHTHVLGNHFHHLGRSCTDTAFGITGVFVHAPGVVVEGNEFDHIGRLGPGEAGCTPGAPYWQNHDHGVYVDGDVAGGADGTVLINNLFHDLSRGWPIHLFPGSLDRLDIGFNTFVGPNPNVDGAIVIAVDRLSNPRIYANAFKGPRNAAIFVQGQTTTSGALVVDNLTDAPALAIDGNGVSATAAGNHAAIDLLLADDGTPLAKSPLVDGAASALAPGRDLRACARPAGAAADVGAFELQPP